MANREVTDSRIIRQVAKDLSVHRDTRKCLRRKAHTGTPVKSSKWEVMELDWHPTDQTSIECNPINEFWLLVGGPVASN
jgi:hypothetical protein